MLKWLRKQKNMRYLIIGGVSLMFGLWGVAGVVSNRSGPQHAGSIFGTHVSWRDYDQAWRAVQRLAQSQTRSPLPQSLLQKLQRAALGAHRALGCRDLSRADFVVTETGEIYLLEVNTLPGMTPTSLYPEGAQGLGISFAELVSLLVESALARGTPRE